jgi:hypothetical protein
MSQNHVRRDKNGKPLKIGQWVEGEIYLGRYGPPNFVFGKLLVFSGPDKSVIQTDEGKGYEVENSKIEIKID